LLSPENALDIYSSNAINAAHASFPTNNLSKSGLPRRQNDAAGFVLGNVPSGVEARVILRASCPVKLKKEEFAEPLQTGGFSKLDRGL